MSAFKTTVGAAFKSTNFTLQTFMPLILAFGALINFPEDVTQQIVTLIEATVIASVGFWGQIRIFIKEGIKIKYTGNVLTYVFAFIGGLVPWLQSYDLEGTIGGLINALPSGNFTLILAAGFGVINVAYRLFQDKPWEGIPIDGEDEVSPT
jgi:hypothetical protein